MTSTRLVQSLFTGSLDIVGDVHGEINALQSLLHYPGYNNKGTHAEGRRLIFVGDLTDRGPDSPAVVDLVASLMERECAQCVLGNHELNLLLGKERHGNGWFYEKPEVLDPSGRVVPQTMADERTRTQTLALFGSLPLALERENLRIVHACWSKKAIEEVRNERDCVTLFREIEKKIVRELDARGVSDEVDRTLSEQNDNPIKVLTSGPERRAKHSYYAGGKMRQETREVWWRDYKEEKRCVFGHYWRILLEGEDDDGLFDRSRPYRSLGNGNALCIDYSAGKRWRERLDGKREDSFATALIALRWPERILVTDRGKQVECD